MDLLEKWKSEASMAPGIRATFAACDGISTQDAAQATQLAQSLGVTSDIVLANPQLAKREEAARLVEQTPLLEQWAALENGSNAPFVYEDAVPLIAAMAAVPSIGAAKSNLKTAAKLPLQASERIYNILGFGFGALDYMADGTGRVLEYIGFGNGKSVSWYDTARDWALGNAEAIRKYYLNSELLNLPEKLRGRLWDHPEYLFDPEYLSYQFGDAANSAIILLAGGLGGVAAKGGALTAPTLAKMTSVLNSVSEGSALYGDLIKDGVSNENSLSGAIAFGSIIGMIEKAGIGKVLEGSKGDSLMRTVAGYFLDGVTEGFKEYVAEPIKALLSGVARGDASEKMLLDFANSLTNVDAIPGALLLGSGMRHISDNVQKAQSAREYSQDLMALYDKVEASSTRSISPAHMQSALEFAGEAMREQVAIPADAALKLYQNGIDLLSPLGITEEAAQKLAAQDQNFLVPVAQLPAYLDRQQFEAAAQILRRTPDAMNAVEAAQNKAKQE